MLVNGLVKTDLLLLQSIKITKIVINSVEYSFELYNDHGWRFKLTSGDKEGYVAPFIGGFDLVLGDTADTLVAADYESFNGEWYYNGKY